MPLTHQNRAATTPSVDQTVNSEPRFRIEIWSDIACPWCFIGKRRLEAALETFPNRDNVDIVWRSFQLVPGLPALFPGTEGEYLQQVRGISAAQVEMMFAQTIVQAKTVGLDYDFDRVVVANSMPALQLLHLAERYGATDAVKEALLTARFLTGENTGDPDVLTRIGTNHGVPEAEIRSELESGSLIPEVNTDIAEAHRLGIQGVPHFRFSDTVSLSGAQPTTAFSNALESAWNQLKEQQTAAFGMVCTPDGCATN